MEKISDISEDVSLFRVEVKGMYEIWVMQKMAPTSQTAWKTGSAHIWALCGDMLSLSHE